MAAVNPSTIPIVNNNYYLDIFLTQTYNNLGQYEIIQNKEIFGDLTQFDLTGQTQLPPIEQNQSTLVVITGYTQSRLPNVVTYTGEYIVGVNGVTYVSDEYIGYEINNILYITYLDTGVTIYGFGKLSNEFERQDIIRDDNSVAIDVKKTLDAFIIDRSNTSVYDYFNRINGCDNLDDILDIF
jgi:hypothetical protein